MHLMMDLHMTYQNMVMIFFQTNKAWHNRKSRGRDTVLEFKGHSFQSFALLLALSITDLSVQHFCVSCANIED
jgi:hypothetical protein